MRSVSIIAVLGLSLALAPAASANWDLKAKSTCWEGAEGTTKLEKEKGKNDEIVADCLDVAVSDPSVAEHSLVFDSDFRELHVIRNCDSLVICDLSSLVSCATAIDEDGPSYKLKQRCVYELLDIGDFEVFGSMICKQSESYNDNKNKFKFDASCEGNLDFDGTPCTLSFKTGKLFEESGVCPK